MKRLGVEEFKQIIKNRVLLYDGAMGTSLIAQNLSPEDYGGKEGCSEALLLYRPDAVKEVHKNFIKSGCDVIETNTFNATRISLKEYGLENKVDEINRKAVEIAREAIDEINPAKDVFIAGSIGPTSSLPSLGHIDFDEMSDAYFEQLEALWDAGVDIFQLETCQDLLQIKAALIAAQKLFENRSERCVMAVSVTLESSGTMLVGSDISAICATIEPFDFVDVLGLNCATGPLEMVRHVDHLCRHWPRAVSVMPNAGLPENIDGKPVYKMTPEEFSDFQYKFAADFGANIVGGCCGTRPEHIAAVKKKISGLGSKNREVISIPQVASLFSAVTLKQKPAPALIGERTNANGAKQFRELLTKEDWSGMVAMGREQARGGAHLIDLSVALVGRDEVSDMKTLASKFATQVNLPLVIDSTSAEVVEVALKRHGGRCVINSVNLEDGGEKLRKVASLAQKFKAAIICLTIDEQGMAKTAEAKFAVAERIFKILSAEFGFRPEDLIFDPLTFTIGSGDSELKTSAKETLLALRLINEKLPGVYTLLGVSNVSFGLSPESREILNSIFLQEAVAAGLTCAIVNPAKLLPVHKIKSEIKELTLDLIYDRKNDGQSLKRFIKAFSRVKSEIPGKIKKLLSPSELLSEKIIEGDSSDLKNSIDKLLKTMKPQSIINEVVLPAMKKVGDLFGSGQLQLPFVLQSAETVKKTVSLIQPFLKKVEGKEARKIVLATVAGDVHDIGKNLVNIMLSNNGFEVIDVGIKADIDKMISAAREHNAEAIGMSGLLVRSTQVMKENLEELNRRKFFPDVILGGAALTKEFVDNNLAKVYLGRLSYAKDAVDSVKIMQQLVIDEVDSKKSSVFSRPKKSSVVNQSKKLSEVKLLSRANRHQFVNTEELLSPPFWATHLLEISSDELFGLLSHKTLFQARWGFKQGQLNAQEYEEILESKARPALNRIIEINREKELFQAQAVYGYFRCRGNQNSIKIFDKARITIGEFEFPRQKQPPHLCLADFVACEIDDVIALWAVTLGNKVIEEGRQLFENDEYVNYHFLTGLAAELADCAAVSLHRHIHCEMFPNLPLTENLPGGRRYSFGYPACPDISQQKELFHLISPEKIGLQLTDSFQMEPEFSVSGFVLFNPHARYFVP
jgi:5-methyltetrahydrofolate--homocysteine methyltransferase